MGIYQNVERIEDNDAFNIRNRELFLGKCQRDRIIRLLQNRN